MILIMGNSTIQYEYTIQKCHISSSGSGNPNHSRYVDLICIQNGCAQQKKIAAQ